MGEVERMEQSQGKCYLQLVALAGERTLDSSYHAAFYLLSTDPELMAAASRQVSVDGINFAGVKRDTRGFDDTSKQIVDIAHNLFSWNSRCKATPFDISRLGYPHMEQVFHAFYIASGEYQIVIETDQENNPVLKLDAAHYQKTQRMHRQFGRVCDEMQGKSDMGREMEW